jgi:ketosteroid isomerase-like protein
LPRPFALAGAAHQSGDVDELDLGFNFLGGFSDIANLVEPGVGYRDPADIGFDRAERIIGRLRRCRFRQRVEERRFANVGQADDTAAEAHAMGKLLAAGLALAAFAVAPAAASVVPLTPEQIAMLKAREGFETQARNALGDPGLIEELRDWRRNWGFILVGKQGPGAPPRLLVKDEHGWYELRAGETRRIPDRLGLELNRLLHRSELWEEDTYNFHSACQRTPRLFVIMHAGKDRFGRLGCGPQGVAARVARTAEALRVQPGEARTTAPPSEQRRHPPGAPAGYFEASNRISAQLFEMAAAWERKTLAGFVEPYAEDVIVERPEGVLRGRRAVVDWARDQQDWDAPYQGAGGRMTVHQIVSDAQEAKDVFYTRHELRFEENGAPVRQTFSTMWRNRGGLWLIAHERVSEVKPVTSERTSW